MSRDKKVREVLRQVCMWNYSKVDEAVKELNALYKPDQEKMPKIDEGKISELLRPLLRIHHVTRDHKTKYHYALCCYLAKAIVKEL